MKQKTLTKLGSSGIQAVINSAHFELFERDEAEIERANRSNLMKDYARLVCRRERLERQKGSFIKFKKIEELDNNT